MRAAFSLLAAPLATVLAVAGCAGAPRQPAPPPDAQGRAIAAVAASLVGTPYHFGGADGAGFDCSGLALYVHERVGLAIPRTALEQRRAAHAVAREQLAPGDLVFFHIRGHRVDHVGIFAVSLRVTAASSTRRTPERRSPTAISRTASMRATSPPADVSGSWRRRRAEHKPPHATVSPIRDTS
jgi:cell wall-associated NlpC family hydrolase